MVLSITVTSGILNVNTFYMVGSIRLSRTALIRLRYNQF